jgi:hypothetical protein
MSNLDATEKADAIVSKIINVDNPVAEDTGIDLSENLPPEASDSFGDTTTPEERQARSEFDKVTEKEREEWLYSVLYGDGIVTWDIPLATEESVARLRKSEIPVATFSSMSAKTAREIRVLETTYGASKKIDDILYYQGNIMLLNTAAELIRYNDKEFEALPADPSVATLKKRLATIRDTLTPAQLSVAVSAHSKFSKKLLACTLANQWGFF